MLKLHVPDLLWTADMPASKAGFEFGARMTVVRLIGGGLWIHSPIQLSSELRRELDALGPARCIVAPSGMHYEHVPEFHRAYPEAKIYVARAAQKHLSGTRVDGVLTDAPMPEWADVMEQAEVRGSKLYDEIVFLHRPTRTLILTDLLFNIPRTRGFSTNLWTKVLGIQGKPSASVSFRMTVKDRETVREVLQRVAGWDFDRVTLTHGDNISTGGKAAFLKAFDWLLK